MAPAKWRWQRSSTSPPETLAAAKRPAMAARALWPWQHCCSRHASCAQRLHLAPCCQQSRFSWFVSTAG